MANGGLGWNLRDFVYDGERPQTWDNIARWTEGILSWENEIPWSKLKKDNEWRRKKILKKIAVVNLKKIPSGHISDGKTIYDAVLDNGEIIKKHLALYNADFIICCGTESAFVNDYYKGQGLDWKMTDRGVWFFRDGKTVLISFAHPEARVRDFYLYYALLDAVREIMAGASI
ncbi:hypothetical protein [Faecalicoccus pleomorphus]|uniref:hypothetical protein n=1 Tax=Faecalicoccus pleomorphus TaxID=1323 RepID=UPI0039F645ED